MYLYIHMHIPIGIHIYTNMYLSIQLYIRWTKHCFPDVVSFPLSFSSIRIYHILPWYIYIYVIFIHTYNQNLCI